MTGILITRLAGMKNPSLCSSGFPQVISLDGTSQTIPAERCGFANLGY